MTPERSLYCILFLSENQSFKLITRLAGFSGFLAVVLTVYGSNVLIEESEVDQLRKKVLHNASKNHFIHTFGLLHCSKASYPYLTALLFSSGMVLYCGICYKFAIWNDRRFGKYTPIGGYLFMLGWCSFIL
uniref:Transmembrane protein 256 homolog n=1 Tax=Ditylenchus dipsaci TaxID=166011 RepID=A0A915DTV3_9BILA